MTKNNFPIRCCYFAILSILTFSLFHATSRADDSVDRYAREFPAIESLKTAAWQETPKSELESLLQFFVDQAKSNFSRIRYWQGKYEQFRIVQMNSTQPTNLSLTNTETRIGDHAASFAECNLNYNFLLDNTREKIFIDQSTNSINYYDDNGAKIEEPWNRITTDIRAILKVDECAYFEYGDNSNFYRQELEGVQPGRIGKVVTIDEPSRLNLGMSSRLFDPRLFFYDAVYPTHRPWDNLENGYLKWLRGESGKELQSLATDALTLFKTNIGGEIWYRLVYQRPQSNMTSVFVYNSGSNYNLAHYSALRGDVPFLERWISYRKINEIFIPDKCLIVYDSWRNEKSIRFFNLVDCTLNQKIPDEQFEIEALQLDEDVIVMNNINSTSYFVNADGEVAPLAKYGEKEPTFGTVPFWESPLRITAFVVGVMLLVVGVTMKLRKKRRVEVIS